MRATSVLFVLLLGTAEAFLPNQQPTNHGISSTLSVLSSTTKKQYQQDTALRLSTETPESTTKETSSEDSNDLELLQDALVSFESSSAKQILQNLREMRDQDMNASVQYLNRLLQEGPDRKLPFWTKVKTIARFSKRARLASLKRTLDMTTPPPEDDAIEITAEDQLRRRRRALVSLIQSLSNNPNESTRSSAIRFLERKARSAQKGGSPEDLWNRRPLELETPNYTVVAETPAYQIRAYDPFSVCSVSMSQARPEDSYKTDATVSDPKMQGARAFGALAGYLFGKNQQESAMKMTTPVLTSNYGTDNKQMSFVLPSDYWKDDAFQTAPQPLEGSGVVLETKPASNRAVVMFGGYAAKAQVEKQKKKLMDALDKDKEWEMVPGEEISLAQYNDPFTPPWKRLNEVSVSVRKKQ